MAFARGAILRLVRDVEPAPNSAVEYAHHRDVNKATIRFDEAGYATRAATPSRNATT